MTWLALIGGAALGAVIAIGVFCWQIGKALGH